MQLPLGDGTVEFELPECDVTVVEPPGGHAVDVREAAMGALADPSGPALSTLPDPGDEVAVVVTDVTRATPDEMLVDLLLDNLAAAGVTPDQVTIVVGLGLHRPLSDAELEELLGEYADLAVNHDPDDAIEVGPVETAPGDPERNQRIPVEIHRTVATADLVVSTGMVEPHQYAGFSGGAKTVVVGAGGEPLIRHTHGPEMLSRDGVRLGRVEGNPFREHVDRAGDLAGPDFCLNVAHTPAGILDVAAGEHRAVVRELAASAREALSVPVEDGLDEDGRSSSGRRTGGFDAVVAGVGAPKDANLYQASRAATYVALGDRNPLRDGGSIVVPAELPEGAGKGTGEKRFYRRLRGADDAAALYEEMREGYEPGAQRAFVTARVLREYDVYVTNSRHPEIVEECLMRAREYVAEAVDPGSDVLVVPDALNTLLVDPE